MKMAYMKVRKENQKRQKKGILKAGISQWRRQLSLSLFSPPYSLKSSTALWICLAFMYERKCESENSVVKKRAWWWRRLISIPLEKKKTKKEEEMKKRALHASIMPSPGRGVSLSFSGPENLMPGLCWPLWPSGGNHPLSRTFGLISRLWACVTSSVFRPADWKAWQCDCVAGHFAIRKRPL